MARSKGKAGILTFHCADNLGAMLQAYGLLTFLNREGYDAFIINYSPDFLTGRDKFIPYVPYGKLSESLSVFLWLLKRNIKEGGYFFKRRHLMKEFRDKYLTKGSRSIKDLDGLTKVNADFLILGSDQIWNPDITFGLKPAYFGAFENPNFKKRIAYSASFGSSKLKSEHELRLSKLLNSVDDISMREDKAAEYINERFNRHAVHTVDPVFLLESDEWLKISKSSGEKNYMFYYETQKCEPLRKAAVRTAQKKGLKIIGLSVEENDFAEYPIKPIEEADPPQFIGYIDGAQYVFTNSFHGLAFSLIFRKQFYTYNHTTVGSRLQSLLNTTNLNNRMATDELTPDIDGTINWQNVERLLNIEKEKSKEFLRCSLKL